MWGRLITCGRLLIGPLIMKLYRMGRLPIGRRFPTCPTVQPEECYLSIARISVRPLRISRIIGVGSLKRSPCFRADFFVALSEAFA